jgi:hypothetical protein
MIRRIACVSVALFASLAAASVCLAAEPSYAPRKGGVGGAIGGSDFLGAGDYSAGAQPRFSFTGSFRYVVRPHWRWQVAPGFTWSAYKIDQHLPPSLVPNISVPSPYDTMHTKTYYLTLLAPISAQLQYVAQHGSWMYHAGFGPGAYRVWVEDRRKVLRDPQTFRLHRGVYPGFTVELGGEKFLKSITTTSIELVAVSHYVFSRRDQQFPSGFNDKLWAVDFRVGVNYYFDLIRGKKLPGSNLPGISQP